MHIITSLPIDSEIPDNDILAHTRKRIKQAEIIDIPKFPLMMFDSLLSIGDKLEKLENQIDKTYYMFVSTMAKQKADRNESKESFVKTMEECENDLALKLKTFKWIYETGTIESIFDILECKVRKEESVLDERIKGLKELTDEQRKIKSEKLKKKRVKTQPKEEKKEKGKIGTKEKNRDKQVSADSSKDTNSSFISDNSTTNSVCTQSTAKTSNNQSDETESHLPPLMTQEMQERHKKILEKSLEEMNVKNIPENSKHEISQNKFICNEGESFRDLEIYAEAHEMIRQHYFIANEKQKVESILKEIPEACIETLQLHLKTKNERLYSVFALEKNTDEIIDKLSIHFEYKETITKEEYDDKIDRMNKLCSIIAVTNNNLDLYLSTNYSEVLKVLLHVKFFRVYIESILHYGIGNIKFFVIENKIAEWRKILGEWRFSRRLCKDLKFGDIFPHTFVGKNEEEYAV